MPPRENRHEVRPPDSGNVKLIDVDKLQLDSKNPRLASSEEVTSEFSLLKILWNEMAVNELVLSIAANGYFPQEPLLVIPDTPKSQKTTYTVIEGNRRVAAVRILLDAGLRKKLRATDVPSISASLKRQLQQLPAYVYGSRKELWAYLGFRHINSPKAWDAFSKAKYVAQICEDYGKSLTEIADQIGDTHRTVERLYLGYRVFQQTEKETDFRLEDVVRNRFYFNYLYTALQYDEYKHFLGIRDRDVVAKKPVRSTYLPQLDELMTWLYGKRSKNVPPVIRTQNPDLNRLRYVIRTPAALRLLRSGYPLDRAYEKTAGDSERFQKALISAKEELEQAKATVTTGYQGDEESLRIARDVEKLANSLRADMEGRLQRSKGNK